MANTSKFEPPPDTNNQATNKMRFKSDGPFPASKGETKISASRKSEAAPAGVGVKNSNVKKQKVSPEIDGPMSTLSEFIKTAVKNAFETFVKTTTNKVSNRAQKAVDTIEKITSFFTSDNSANLTGRESEEAKKKAEAKVETDLNRNIGIRAQTERFLKSVADQIKRFTDALTALLNPALDKATGSSSGYVGEGVQAVNGLRELVQNVSRNAPPQLQQRLEADNLGGNSGMLNWLDRLGAALKTGDERALQSFANEWNDFQKRMDWFLNRLEKVSENSTAQKAKKERNAADEEMLRRSYRRMPTTPEAEQRKLNQIARRKSESPVSAPDRKQNQRRRVLTSIEAEQKKLAGNHSNVRRSENALGVAKQQKNRKGTLTTLQAERKKLSSHGKRSMADTLVPLAVNTASKSGQVIDVSKMKVPVSENLALLRKTTTMVK